MKIYNGSEYIKLVPQKFEPIKGRIPKLVDSKFKRLSDEERRKLEIELFRYQIEVESPLVHELIIGAEFKGVSQVTHNIPGRGPEYTVMFKTKDGHNLEVICSKFDAKKIAVNFKEIPKRNIAKQLNLINYENQENN